MYLLIEIGGAIPRDAQGLPPAARKMFGEHQDLAGVMGVVGDLAVDRLHDRMRLSSYGYGAAQVRIGQRLQRAENDRPSVLPKLEERLARGRGVHELAVALAVRFFSVRREEIGPSRSHVAGHVLHDD